MPSGFRKMASLLLYSTIAQLMSLLSSFTIDSFSVVTDIQILRTTSYRPSVTSDSTMPNLVSMPRK